MRRHDELDQLSALVDGELTASERVTLEAHVASCEDCRVTLDAIRATLTDLRALPEPVPTEQDSWALRSAIRRARGPARRWQRLAWASGAAAASVVAVVAIVAGLGGNRSADLAAGPEAARDSVTLQTSGRDYDPASAQAHLLSVAGIATDAPLAEAPPVTGGAAPGPNETPVASGAGAGGGTGVFGSSSDSSARVSAEAAEQELNACASAVMASTQERLVPWHYEAATFEGRPAFLLVFHTEDRYELWVVARPSCDVLYFAQAG